MSTAESLGRKEMTTKKQQTAYCSGQTEGPWTQPACVKAVGPCARNLVSSDASRLICETGIVIM